MPNGKNPEYSIVIPAHNEEGNILPFVTRIIKMATSNRLSYEVIAVDDVSSDNTGKLLDKLSDKFPQIRVIHRFSKNGPGNAERAGFAIARGKWIITLDSDLSHRPEEIPDFIAAANKGFDMVIGSRFVSGGSMDGPAFRLLLSQSCAFAAKLITGYPLHDASSGYRIMRASALQKLNLKSGWFEIHTEIPIKFHLHGYKVGEIPIQYERRGEGQSKLTIFQSVPKYLGIMLTEKIKKILGNPEYTRPRINASTH
jgi:glycosyltransferase involved in cell wall biosynthesis